MNRVVKGGDMRWPRDGAGTAVATQKAEGLVEEVTVGADEEFTGLNSEGSNMERRTNRGKGTWN